jgi:hypothetical protein
VTLLAHDSTENVLRINSVAESATFRQVNKNNIHVNNTDSILCYLIYLPMQDSVQRKLSLKYTATHSAFYAKNSENGQGWYVEKYGILTPFST